MKIKTLLTAWVLWSTLNVSAQEESQNFQTPPRLEPPVLHLHLVLGEQRIISCSPQSRFTLGGQSVRSLPLNTQSQLPPLKDKILLKAFKKGTDTLTLWKNTPYQHPLQPSSAQIEKIIQITVHPHSFSQTPEGKILQSLQEFNSIQLTLVPEGILVRGTFTSIDEAHRFGSLLQSFQSKNLRPSTSRHIIDQTTLSPALAVTVIGRLENEIQKIQEKFKGSILQVHYDQKQIYIEGSFRSTKEKNYSQNILESIFAKIVFQAETLGDTSPTIAIKVYLLELKKASLKKLGLNLDLPFASLQAKQLTQFITNPSSRISNLSIQSEIQMNGLIDALEGEGSAKILSNPELVVRVPGNAELFAGGELPIRTESRHQSQIQWKNFGLKLKINTQSSTYQQVRLDIESEVSHIDPTLAIDKIPGLISNRLKTQVDALFQQPLLLSGLLQESTKKRLRGLPYLASLPIFGALFGSTEFQHDRSELVAILFPKRAPGKVSTEQLTLNSLQSDLNERYPLGSPPIPRNYIDNDKINELRSSEEYPWNALQ